METTRRQFIQASALAALAAVEPTNLTGDQLSNAGSPDAFEIAHSHLISRDLPTPGFFEGMLLGNGDVGVCVVVRPDALGLHIGKNDCWDIRVSEGAEDHALPFPELLKLWHRASEEAKRLGKPNMLNLENNIDFFLEYKRTVVSSYDQPWPRPWPCGTVWVHWDPRWVQPGLQTLDPANGLFTLELACVSFDSEPHIVKLSCFVDWHSGLISVSSDATVSFLSVSYHPAIDHGRPLPEDPKKSKWDKLPSPDLNAKAGDSFAEFSCFQSFLAIGPTAENPSPSKSDKDRDFSLCARAAAQWSVSPADEEAQKTNPVLSLISGGKQRFRLDIKVATPRDILLERLEREATAAGERDQMILIAQDRVFSPEELDTPGYARRELNRLALTAASDIQRSSEAQWRKFWSHSAIQLQDKELERIWYHNQYFLACCLRPGKVAPGLFGNWCTTKIGTDWHGDYHMDYNCQQVFWGVFSSNHVEQHMPYVELSQNLMQMSERFAREKIGLPGACFPLSAFPVPSQAVPVPAPFYAYMMSMTPWTVQSLWWQYLYTQDVDYLRRVYPMLRAAAQFMAAYAKKGEDGKYHIIPTVSPENWGCTVDFRLNKDCIMDLALTQFLLDAAIEGSNILSLDGEAKIHWQEIREHLASYPKAKGPYGEVWLDVVDAPVEHVYNVPATLAPVFPAEQVGLGRGASDWDIARRTAQVVRLEGGNDLVFQPLIRARLGMLDLDWFKREVRYCTLPNGVANGRVREVVGRYRDSTDFDFMMHMGFWTENFSLPVVINECMMQSYTGTIRLFPNTNNLGPAHFENLRAAGAFLVSGAYDGTTVTQLSLLSEKGNPVRLARPWGPKAIQVTHVRDARPVAVRVEEDSLVFDTEPGERYHFEPASA
jgi:alpha-L-fucosidase 2